MLNSVANLDKEVKALGYRKPLNVGVIGDRNTLDQLHNEIRAPRLRRAAVKHLGNVRMLHHRERLAFIFEASQNLASVHAELNDFQSDTASHGLKLLGHPD